jgi:nitrate reductase gamma subunit
MALLVPVLVVIALGLAGSVAGGAARYVVFAGAAVFVFGVIAKVIGWARTPVPFAIATTCGQQKSLPWIEQDRIENPSTTAGVVARVALEVLCFRSLFRNTTTSLRDGRLSYLSNKWLWAAGLAFHYSMLVVLLRHARFFFQPPPAFVALIARADGFFQIGMPEVYVSTLVFIGAAAFLLARRIF